MFRPGWLVVVSIVLKIKPRQLVEKKDPITWKSLEKTHPLYSKTKGFVKGTL